MLSSHRRVGALALRLLMVLCIVLAVAGLAVRLPENRQAAVFVADLSASDSRATATMNRFIDRSLRQRQGDALAGVVTVGRQALVDSPVTSLNRFSGFQTRVDPNATNLEDGLLLGHTLLPDTYRHRVVLLTDGRQTTGDALSAARSLRKSDVRVDVAPVTAASRPDVSIRSVRLPARLRVRETVPLRVSVGSSVSTAVRVTVARDGHPIASRTVRLTPGDRWLTFDQPPAPSGFHAYSVRVQGPQDADPRNDTGSGFTVVEGAQRVLVVAGVPAEARNVVASLRASGFRVDIKSPFTIHPTLDSLRPYASVTVVDTPAEVLGQRLMSVLVPYVRDLGRGLVVVGGEAAYGVGGYSGTPLERLLPVSMGLPRRSDVPTVAVVLVIEDLETDRNVEVSKEAGKALISVLSPQDQVAVNDTPDFAPTPWAVRLRYVTDKPAINRAIDDMTPGDPDDYMQYLRSAAGVLQSVHAAVKHIVFLGDGDASDARHVGAVQQIRLSGITVSTVATDDAFGMGDPGAMRLIAQAGGGRYYRAHDVARVPQIFLREAHAISRSGIISGTFLPRAVSSSPLLHGLTTFPPLDGYVLTRIKPTGESVLESPKHDPVLAQWQFGLGRTVAWTSDSSGRWSSSWLRSSSTKAFWVNLVSWSLPVPTAGPLGLVTRTQPSQATVLAQIPTSLGIPRDVVARITDPRGRSESVSLQPYAPERYRLSFATPVDGAYRIRVRAQGSGGTLSDETGAVATYPAEYRDIGVDLSFLRTLARAGGGNVITNPREVWASEAPVIYAPRSLDTLLWLLALLLLPADVAIRRLALRRRDLGLLGQILGRGQRVGGKV